MNGESDKQPDPIWCFHGGFLVCGVAWGVMIGGALSTLLYIDAPELRGDLTAIEFSCVCIGIAGTIGLAVGVWADAKIHDSDQRSDALRKSWRLLVIVFALLAVSNGFWLPAVQ